MDFIHKFTPGKLPVTVLLLHGSGGDEDDLLPIAKALAPGAAFLSPRGNVVQNGIRRFFSFPGPDGFDREELIERAGDLEEWLGRMCADYGIDASRLYALGYSNGANIAAAVMMLHPGAIAGACLLRARALVVPEVLPALKDAPVVILAGQTDHLIPAADSERLGRLMSEAGAKVDFVLQNAGHDLTPADFSLAKQWFARLL
jgi:phospholipase/carboxylesterase